MKKLTTIVSDIRVHALLCCSAAVLLTACGGGVADTGAAQPTQTAAYSSNSGVVASQEVATTPASDTAETTPAVADAAPAAGASFDLAGYASHPLSTDAATTAAPEQSFAADGTPKLLASSVAIDVTASAT